MISSCENTNKNDSAVINDGHTPHDIIKIRSTLSSSQSDDFRNGFITPSTELLKQVVDEISADSLFNINAAVYDQNYGNLRINAALLTVIDDTHYTVSIPFEKNRKVTGILYYMTSGDHSHFATVSYADAKSLIGMTPNGVDSIDALFVLALHDMNYYQSRRLHTYDEEVNNFLLDYLNHTNGDLINRSVTIVKGWEITVGDTEGKIGHIYYDVTYTHIPCQNILGPPSVATGFYIPPNSKHIWASNGSGNSEGTSSGTTITEQILALKDADPDCRDFALTETVLQFLEESLYNSVDPCNDKSGDELIQDILDVLCYAPNPLTIGIATEDSNGEGNDDQVSNLITMDDVNGALEDVDKIKVDPALKNQCPKLACIIENMQNGDLGTSLVCNAFGFFADDNAFSNLNMYAQSFANNPMLEDNNFAATTTSLASNNTTITFNLDNCGGENLFNVFETVQHELIHASIQSALIREFGYSFAGNSYEEAFNLLLNETYGPYPTDAEHRLMLDRFLIPMVNSLIEMNGGSGNYFDFVGLVLNGFPAGILEAAGYNITDVVGLAEHSKTYINNTNNIINQTLFSCG